MMISVLDIFYLTAIIIIFGYIVHIETSLKILTEMMKEHTKCDSLLDIKKTLDE